VCASNPPLTSTNLIFFFETIGILIPNDVEKLSQFRSKAHLVLVVEKDSTFQKLIDDKIERFIGDCILITVRVFLFLME
jgi:DNA topoisomerase VI subunit A